MLYLIGLGLNNEKDITVNGLEVVQRAERVYLEAYTAILMVGKDKLEAFYGRDVIIADRELVESSSGQILLDADTKDIAFLVVGDPLGATTHTDLLLRARNLSIPTRTIHNASIMTAIASTGLQLYSFGQTLSMVFFTPEWRPSSWYDRLIENAALGLHTLVLLDIKVKEMDLHALARRVGKYGKPRFMTVAECARQMIEIEEEREEGVCGPDTLVVGVARLGTETQKIVSGTLAELAEVDMGEPLHSLVVVGKKCHELEKDYVREFAVSRENWDRAWDNRGYGGL
ncbi:Diphthine synthase [Terfezia boudieri ATCC MYA-4762]|uniref:Diphthine methyl ester synthase n=1 Tax=Terfezia boudieri ATCC MYA-4762 TaxID=1051890 RepID=A0A3N4LCM1_9PEZI|nr:Diphthine synthase [Terfezia boudieri ATCC MYA-4762]